MHNGRILVVGGSAGIGKAVADSLGDRALVWSRRQGVDATDPAQIHAAAAALLATHGAPWGLVHTVGDFREQPLLGSDASDFAQLLHSNLTTLFLVVQALLPAMVAQQRGRVVLFGAAGIERGRAMTRAPVYFACKAAVAQLARSLAAEVAPAGVTVNVVSPGLISHQDSHQQSQQRLLGRVPLGRLGGVGDVVSLVRWLLDEQSGYVTGENFTVDGGLQL